MENFIAEASSQARGYTRCGSELIVNEIATGTSNISHQDAFQVALKLAQQKADATLKEELMKIDMGNKPCIRLIGRPGVDGNRGKRGAKGDKGDAGAFPFELPSQFLSGTTFVIPANLLSQEQNEMLDAMIDNLRMLSDFPNSKVISTADLGPLQSQFGEIIGSMYGNYSDTTTVDLSQAEEPFTTNYRVADKALATSVDDYIMNLCDYYPDLTPYLVKVKKKPSSTDTAAAAIGEVGTDAVAAAEGDSVTYTYIIALAAILSQAAT